MIMMIMIIIITNVSYSTQISRTRLIRLTVWDRRRFLTRWMLRIVIISIIIIIIHRLHSTVFSPLNKLPAEIY